MNSWAVARVPPCIVFVSFRSRSVLFVKTYHPNVHTIHLFLEPISSDLVLEKALPYVQTVRASCLAIALCKRLLMNIHVLFLLPFAECEPCNCLSLVSIRLTSLWSALDMN